jgi:hypothetical protein
VDHDGRLAFQAIRSVCPEWRAVSLSSPILWSSLSVSCQLSDHDQHAADIGRMNGWFSRSGPVCPLELEFVEESISKEHRRLGDAFEAFIQRYQHRWRFLSLRLDPSSWWDVLFRPPSLNWSSLQTVKLWAYHLTKAGDEETRNVFLELQKMPALRCIIVEDDTDLTFQERYSLAVRQDIYFFVEELHLILDNFHISHGRIISSYQNLTTLIVAHLQPVSLRTEDHFDWPTVSSFTLGADHLTLLNHLTIPNLVKLAIQLTPIFKESDRDSRILSGFLARSDTYALRSVTIDCNWDEKFLAKALPTLANIPKLEHLDLSKWPSDWAMAFARETSKEDWFPSLKRMTISMGFHDLEVQRMKELAVFLRRRGDFGLAELKALTVHRRRRAAEFPYELFKDVGVAKISVMVPW